MYAYFAELEKLWSAESKPTAEEERALMRRYGMNRRDEGVPGRFLPAP
jgi:hypothetical protein